MQPMPGESYGENGMSLLAREAYITGRIDLWWDYVGGITAISSVVCYFDGVLRQGGFKFHLWDPHSFFKKTF